MNYFIIYPLLVTPMPLIAMAVLIFVTLILISNYKKRKRSDAFDWKIKVSDEIISTQGFRGRVVKIEGETVSICMVGGVMKECLLSDCIPMEEIMSRAKFLKLGEYIETYRLIIARRLYKFPLHTPAAKALKWVRNTQLSLRGIEIMLAFALVDLLLNLEDIFSFLESGIMSYFEKDAMQDMVLSIFVVTGILVGGILHLVGLYRMEDLSHEKDAKAMTLVHRCFYFFFMAEIVDFFPLAGWISVVLYIIGFVLLLVGYRRLKDSGWQNELSRSGFSQAFTASIFLLIGYIASGIGSSLSFYFLLKGYIVPDIGSILSFIGYVIYYLAWKNYICKSTFEDPDWWEIK